MLRNLKIRIFPTIVFIVIFNIIVLLIGYKIDSFQILKSFINDDDIVCYEISNSNLMIVIVICVINVLAIYHIIITQSLHNQLVGIDKSGHLSEGIKKIEVHLMNYNSDTVAFEHLSAIELEVGLAKQEVHNEIWILTNNFEEKNDSKEGQELRDAIIANLRTNVDYYYVIPKSGVDEIEQLGEKLRSKIGTKKINGKFQYIVDDALDFIPTPYFDIIMYIKVGAGKKEFAESSSQIYYCFSRSTASEDCFYQKVDSRDIWNKMTKRTKEYKEEKMGNFHSIL